MLLEGKFAIRGKSGERGKLLAIDYLHPSVWD